MQPYTTTMQGDVAGADASHHRHGEDEGMGFHGVHSLSCNASDPVVGPWQVDSGQYKWRCVCQYCLVHGGSLGHVLVGLGMASIGSVHVQPLAAHWECHGVFSSVMQLYVAMKRRECVFAGFLLPPKNTNLKQKKSKHKIFITHELPFHQECCASSRNRSSRSEPKPMPISLSSLSASLSSDPAAIMMRSSSPLERESES
jgi:hypothetical protein